MNRSKSTWMLGVSAVALWTAAAPAHAQDANKDDGANREIVVTAQFREQRLQDTPLAITAVNAAMLEQRGQTSVESVAAQAPNVTLAPQGQQNGSGMIAFIRGVGQTDFNFALEPGVGIYVDDVYIPTLTGSLLDLMDLDRVEILRGPQGTLAGRNSLGGAIKLFSAKPKGDGHGSLQATYGSFNRIDVRGLFDVALADNLFVRISGVSKNHDGYVTRLDYAMTHPGSGVPTNAQGATPELGTLGGQSYAAGRAAFRWLPTPDIEINIAGDYTADRSESGASVLLYGNNASKTTDGLPLLPNTINGAAVPLNCMFVPSGINSCDTLTGYDGRFVSYSTFLDQKPITGQAPFKPLSFNPHQWLTNYGAYGTIDVHLADDLKLTSITAWRHYISDWAQDVDNTPIGNQQLNQHMVNNQWSEEVRLNGALFDKMLEFTLGGFYFHRTGTLTARVDLGYAGLDFLHGPDPTPATNKAVFGNFTLHPTDALNLTGGIRYSGDDKSYIYYRHNPDGTVPAACPAPPPIATYQTSPPNCLLNGLNAVPASFSSTRLDWRVAADYRFSPELMAYAQVSTGYRAGGVNPRPFFGPSAGALNQVKSFKPETLLAYEAGFKADLFDRRLRFNASVFYNDYKDIILTLSACPISPCLQPNNVGAAHVKGVEFETTIRPVDGLTLDGSLSYLDFKYTQLTGATAVRLNMVTPYTPKWKWSGGIQYDVEDVLKGSLSFRFDGSYQSHVYTEAINFDAIMVSTTGATATTTPFVGGVTAVPGGGPMATVVASNKIDDYFVGNARVTWKSQDRDWSVALEVQNVFDKYYFTSLYEQFGSPGTISGAPAMPRTWAVTVKRNF